MDQEMKVSKEERIQELQEQVKQEEEKKEEAAVALAGRLADILIKADIEEIKSGLLSSPDISTAARELRHCAARVVKVILQSNRYEKE